MTGKERIAQYVVAKSESYVKDQNPIYEIYLMAHPCKELIFVRDGKEVPSGLPDFTGETMGFYYELDTAVHAMNQSLLDIQEACYHAGFILCRFPGLYDAVGPYGRIYFLWDESRQGFYEADEPALFEHVAL